MAAVKAIGILSHVSPHMFVLHPMVRPIDPGFGIRNKLMDPPQPSLAGCSITRNHLIVDINPCHISETPAAVGIDHGPHSHPGVHQLLGVRLGFLAHQHLGKPRSTAHLACGIHPGLGLNGHEDVALSAGFPAPKRSRIQLNDPLAHLVACIPSCKAARIFWSMLHTRP